MNMNMNVNVNVNMNIGFLTPEEMYALACI